MQSKAIVRRDMQHQSYTGTYDVKEHAALLIYKVR